MRSPLNRIQGALPYIGLAILLTATLGAGCSSDQPAAPEGKPTLWVSGLRPGWDVEEMIDQSDAVVVGVVSETLATKQDPGGLDDPPRFYYEFKDFALAVEEVLYPVKHDLPARIAILAETGISSADDTVMVVGTDDIPEFNIGERVLLFLDSLEDPDYADGVGRPVPEGFEASSYFQVVISSKYAKLKLEDGKWKDGRSRSEFTADRLKKAIADSDGTAQ